MKCSNVELWLGELAAHVANVCSYTIKDGAALLMRQNEAIFAVRHQKEEGDLQTAAAETSDTSLQSLCGEGRVNGCRGRAKVRVKGRGGGVGRQSCSALHTPESTGS